MPIDFNSDLLSVFNNIDLNTVDIDKLKILEKELTDKQSLLQFCNSTFQSNMQAFKKYNYKIYQKFHNYETKTNINFFYVNNNQEINAKLDDLVIYSDNLPVNFAKEQIDAFLNNIKPLRLFDSNTEDYYGQLHYRYLTQMNSEILKYSHNDLNSNNRLISEFKSLPLIFFYGVGLGYHITQIYSQIEIHNAVVIEPHDDIFYASLYVQDYASLLQFLDSQGQNIEFIIGDSCNNILYELESYLHANGRFMGACSANFVHYADEAISEILSVIMNQYKFINMSKGFFDDSLFGLSHSIHSALREVNFVKENASLERQYLEKPVFIIGNGPSLDNDVKFLRKNQDKAFIVACGTAIDTLYHLGIKPDFYVATERVSQIAEGLVVFHDNGFLDDIILIGSNVLHKDVLDKFKHIALFVKRDESFYNLFERELQAFKNVEFMNPLVSNLALSAMLKLGFREIYLFGCDNGSHNLDKTHSSHSKIYYNNSSLGCDMVNLAKKQHDLVDGNFGGEIITNSIYITCIDRLHKLIYLYKHSFGENAIKVINCSDGAYVPETIPMHSQDINLDKVDNIDKLTFLNTFESTMVQKIHINKQEIDSLFNQNYFNYICDSLIMGLNRDFNTRFEYVQNLYKLASNFNNTDGVSTKFNESLIAGSVHAFLSNLLVSLYSEVEDSKAIAYYKSLLPLFIYFLEDAKVYYTFLPNCIIDKMNTLTEKVGFDHPNSKAPNYPKAWNTLENINMDIYKHLKAFKKCYK